MSVIGIDLGGTKIEGILYGKTIKRRIRLPCLSNMPRKDTLGNLCRIIDELMTTDVKGIGIGTPGFSFKGKLTSIDNVPGLIGFDLRAYVQKRFKTLVRIENDANCFALAETMHGAAKGRSDVIGVIIGTGFGAGIIIDKKIYKGASGAAGEFGHTMIDPKGPLCRCGIRGHLEAFVSGPNIIKRYIKAKGKLKDPDPSKIFSSKEAIARKVADQTLEYLAMGIANMINIINPQAIVIGGGVSNIDFYKELKKKASRYAHPVCFKDTVILKNKLGDSSGVIGAASLVS